MNIVGGIDNRRQVDLGNVLIDPLDLPESAFRNLDRVRTRLFVDRQPYPRPSVNPNDPCDLLPGVFYTGDFLELYGNPVAHSDDRIFHLLQTGVFPRGANHHFIIPPFDCPGRHVDILLTNATEDLVEGKAESFDLVPVEIDVDLSIEPSPYVNSGNAADSLEAILDLFVYNPAHLDGVQIACRAENEDGKTGQVELAQARSFRIVR